MIDGSAMLSALMQSVPGIEQFINLGTTLLGVILTGTAVFKLIEIGKFGEQPGGVRWTSPVMYLLSGVALFNLSSSVDSVLETIYGPSTSVHNLMSYSSPDPSSNSGMLMSALIVILRLYGYITYIRGWLSVRRIGSGQNGSDEVFKAAVVRLIAGVALINIVGTVNVFSSTFGFGDVL